MDLLGIDIIKVIIEILVFLILMVVLTFGLKKLESKNYKILNPNEYFPQEELHSLRQVFILVMMGLFFINVLYTFVFTTDVFSLCIFDIILSLYVAVRLDKSTWKNRVLVLLLIPYGSLTYIIFATSLVGYLDLIHIPVFIYFIIVYYEKFREYTKTNGLGIAIILLFAIIFISFFLTQLSEGVNPLDSLVMVSNAFTSNGYTVLGHSITGKINSIVLVWGGYLLSGVGTATLTAGILINRFNKKIEGMDAKLDNLEKMMEEIKKD